jgi:hypothetical protein
MQGFVSRTIGRPAWSNECSTTTVNPALPMPRSAAWTAACGPVELSFGDAWFVSGGVHAGGVIVNAMSRPGAAAPEGATSGSYFKGNGVFVSPYADVGYRFRRTEAGLFVKQVSIFGEKERGGISDFGSTFVGLRLGVRL